MTIEQAITVLRGMEKYLCSGNPIWRTELIKESVNMACEALVQADTSQAKTQTETENSNLTFEKRTMLDCYNCKRYKSGDECVECRYEPKADTPQTDCETCKYGEDKHRYAHICNECGVGINNYTPQTERQRLEGIRWTDTLTTEEKKCMLDALDLADTPQTDVYDYKGNGKWERSK